MTVERIELDEFHARAKAQGVPREHIATVCVMCGEVQSMASLMLAGADAEEAEKMLGFSCIGRLTGAGPAKHTPGKPSIPAKRHLGIAGCDWTLGGLFRVHKLEVVKDGKNHPCFQLATPEQAHGLRDQLTSVAAEVAA